MIQRSFRYYYLRIIRQRGTPENIAFGMAIGVFFGLLLPLGQIVVALLAATVLKANRVTAFLGTWVSNPATYMFIIIFYVAVGERVTGINLRDYIKSRATPAVAEKVDGDLKLPTLAEETAENVKKPSGFAALLSFGEKVTGFIAKNGVPATIRLIAVWLAAAIPCSIIGFIVSYHSTRIFVEGFRRKQLARRAKKRALRERKAAEEEALRGVHSGLDET